jgi:hypothetical protein
MDFEELKKIQSDFKKTIKLPLKFEKTGPKFDKEKIKDYGGLSFDADSIIPLWKQKKSYNEQYWFRQLNLFQEAFPLLHKYLGAEKFYPLIQNYLLEFPEKDFAFDKLGNELSSFYKKTSSDKLGYDLIRMDYMHNELNQLSDAAVDETIPSELSELKLGSNVILFKESHNIAALRDELLENFKKTKIICKDHFWVYTNRRGQPIRTEMTELSFRLLKEIEELGRFDLGLEKFADKLTSDELEILQKKLFEWSAFWIKKGWLDSTN